jgi:hypothetical protein
MVPSNAGAAVATALAAASLLVPNVARSETSISLNCTPVASTGKDPIVHITVDLTGGDWHVAHYARSGAVYRREAQYSLSDISASDIKTPSWYSWRGVLKGRPYLVMTGLMHDGGDHSSYSERLVDHRPRGGAIVALNQFACTPSTAASNEPSLQPWPPPQPMGSSDQPASVESGALPLGDYLHVWVGPMEGEGFQVPPVIWTISFVAIKDAIHVHSVVINRGNCENADYNGGRPIEPFVLKKGGSISYNRAIACDPIEISVTSDEGSGTFYPSEVNDDVRDGVSARKYSQITGRYPNWFRMYYVTVTSHVDDLTIKKVVADDGLCREVSSFSPRRLQFGQRIVATYVDCNPANVEVTTESASPVFTWDR